MPEPDRCRICDGTVGNHSPDCQHYRGNTKAQNLNPAGDLGQPGLSLVPNRPDAEKAAEYRARMIEALTPVLEIMTEAQRAGFDITFNIGRDGLQRSAVQALIIARHF